MADNTTLPGTGDVIATDDIGGVKYPIGKLAYGPLDTATIVSKGDAFPVGFYTDAADIDTSVTPLAASATYTSPTYDTTLVGPYVNHFIIASHTGTHIHEESVDGTTWDVVDSDAVAAGDLKVEEHYVAARYHRTRFVNDGTLQTYFRHQVVPRHIGIGHEIGIKLSQNTIQGNKTHNTTAPSALAHEVLGFVAKAAAPTYTEGAAVEARVTLSGDQAITLDGESVAVTGAFFQTTQPVSLTTVPSHDITNAGTFAVQATLAAETTKVIGTINVAAAQTIAVTNAGTFAAQAACAGNVAHDAADSGNPIKTGGIARTANPTAVAALDRVDSFYDLEGRQIVQPFGSRGLTVHNTITLSSTTETTLIAAGAAGIFHDVLGIFAANSSATAVSVAIKDATAGTTRATIYVPAGQNAGFMLPIPLTQSGAAANWTATLSAAVSSVYVTAIAVKKTG